MIAAKRPQGVAAERGRTKDAIFAPTRFLRFLNGSDGHFRRGAFLAKWGGGHHA